MTETLLFRILDFGHWYLFGIWYLGFGASYFSYALCALRYAIRISRPRSG
jgi:hypothetical protein